MILDLQDRENLEHFFRHTLLIRDITHNDVLNELRNLSEPGEHSQEWPELGLVREMYKILDGLRKSVGGLSLMPVKCVLFLFAVAWIPSVFELRQLLTSS